VAHGRQESLIGRGGGRIGNGGIPRQQKLNVSEQKSVFLNGGTEGEKGGGDGFYLKREISGVV